MAARQIIKINDSFELNELGIIKELAGMCLKSHEEGVYQGKKEISDKYK